MVYTLEIYNFLKQIPSNSVNEQLGAISTTRLVRGGMLNMKRQSHMLCHVMTLW